MIIMAEFTEGRWKLNPETAILSAHTISAGKPDKKPIAAIFGASFRSVADNTEALANARLIENAPAMFRLLDYIQHELREYGDEYGLCEKIDKLLEIICRENHETEELKPCPFCGCNKPYIADYKDEFTVECSRCDCSTRLCDTKEEAIDAWNTRDNPERAEHDNG